MVRLAFGFKLKVETNFLSLILFLNILEICFYILIKAFIYFCYNLILLDLSRKFININNYNIIEREINLLNI